MNIITQPHLEPTTIQPTIERWQPSPYALLRFAGKPFEELDRLKFNQTVAYFDQLTQLRHWLDEQKTYICDGLLYKEIGRHTGKQRSQLVALKRSIFNERTIAQTQLTQLDTFLPSNTGKPVTLFFERLDQYV